MSENTPPAHQPASPSKSPSRKKSLRGRSLKAAQDDVPPQAAQRRDPNRVAKALEHAQLAARIAEDNRAKEIVVLDLRQATPLLDFFVIATANSRRQSHAIASEIDAEMKKLGERKLGLEGSEEGRWILIDYGDFVVHIFSAEGRSYYALEEIWGDAPQLEWKSDEPRPRSDSQTSTPPAAPSADPDAEPAA
jgi:ribosome-associated protein